MAANLRPTRAGCFCFMAELPKRHHQCPDAACRQSELGGGPRQQMASVPALRCPRSSLALPLLHAEMGGERVPKQTSAEATMAKSYLLETLRGTAATNKLQIAT